MFLVLFLVAITLLISNDNNSKNNAVTDSTETSSNEAVKSSSDILQKGSYQDYSADLLSKTGGTKLLFFHAPWCPQCFALDESIKNSNIPDGVTVFKVDYDTNQDLRKKYGVTIQTTVVKLDEAGKVEKKSIPYDDPSWETVAKDLL